MEGFSSLPFPPPLGSSELLSGWGVWSGRSLRKRLKPATLSSLNVGLGMQPFSTCPWTFENNVCPHSSVTPEFFEALGEGAVDMQKRCKSSVLCPLPALHRRGSSLVAVVSGHFRDHSWAGRTLRPTIYAAFLPSPCSVATGGSGCQWCLSFAGPCELLPATDYWEVSTSGWIHPWWTNSDRGGNTVILDVVTLSTSVHTLGGCQPWEVI